MKIKFLSLLAIVCTNAFAQNPFIGTGSGQGLGQYGYINKSAVTFTTLDRNTHSNVNSLAARWYINGSDILYNVSGGTGWSGCNTWQCGGCNSANLPTANVNPADFGANWAAGRDAYVSVYAYYCGGAFSNAAGTTGYNERKFTIVDLNTTTPSPSLGTTVIGGGCNSLVAGTFTLDVGAASGLSLTRFVTQNTGTASETTLGNTAFKLYYEPATGLEVFDGTESNSQLLGDFGGDATTNNIFGSTSLSIPLSGKTRFYLVACNNPVINASVNMSIINDGISLAPNNNGSFGMLRINTTSLGGTQLLPVTITSLTAGFNNKKIKINWTTASDVNNGYFEIERAGDGVNFERIGKVNATGTAMVNYSFDDDQALAVNYYRIKTVEQSGAFSYSKMVVVKKNEKSSIDIVPNPASTSIIVRGSHKGDWISIFTAAGNLTLQKQLTADNEKIGIQNLTPGNYFVKLMSNNIIEIRSLIISQ